MALQPFTAVEDGIAILRCKHGVQKQVRVYHRGGTLFVPLAGGYVRIVPTSFDGAFSTIHPDAKVLEIEGHGISVNDRTLEFNP